MIKEEIGALDATTIERTPQQELVSAISSKYKFETPIIDEEKAFVSHREVDVAFNRDPMGIFGQGNVGRTRGTEITFTVPFKGDPDLFDVRPTTFSLNPPRGEVQGHQIAIVLTRIDHNAAAVKSEYEKTLRDVKQHIEWLQASTSDFNAKISATVQELLAQRHAKLNADAAMAASMGLPIRGAAAPENVIDDSRAKLISNRLSSPKKWDVFISHASEDKETLVRPLAVALKAAGVAVWFDEFSLKMGDSLRASIDYGLANSRFGVVVLSSSFFAKHWPLQELNGFASRESAGKKVILPIWHKITAEGVRESSPILADRFAVSSELGVDALVRSITEVLTQD